ncbi:MAG: hypothetical protein U0326_07065 [Polyangiales bacterium]
MLDEVKTAGMRRPALVLALLAAAASCTSSNPAPVDSSTPTDVVVDMAPVDVFTGCTSNAGCAGSPGRPICNTSNGQCVSCTTMATACSAAQYCNSATGACEAGCSSDMGCATGGGDGGVDGGGAGGHCDTITHTCVQCVTNDHCPAGTVCRGSTCAAGCSAARACPTGQSCCDGACIDTQSNVSACGMCGNTCRTPNGRPACSMGTCGVGMCTAPYENCDMNAANGCEIDLQNDPNNCGACGNRCPSGSSSMGVCVMGRCSLGCAEGFADCDGMASNGCETDTRVDNANCGTCGRACTLRNATSSCTMGACAVTACADGFANCDSDPSTGCETATSNNILACGRCGNVCNLTNVASHGCAAGACTILTCDPGYADCDGMASNGCEVNTDTSGSNCGVCGRSCGMGMCTRGVCTSTCSGGRGDCDGNATNGCEADLNTETLNCGVCRNSCVAGPQSTARCTSGACSIACNTGFSDCNANPADGCEIDTRVSPTNCGRCGNACASGQVCNDGICVAPCPGVQTRCAGACVSLQTDNTNCGACGTRCATGNTCTDGVCRCAIGTEPLAGVQCGTTCVDVLSSNTNCGTCGNACATGSTCTRGVCRCNISGLPVGILCGATCADPFSDRNNCGRCGNACATGESCVSGTCRCVTATGAMGTTCSGVCSDNSIDRNNCGRCGNACPASQVCTSGACAACPTGTTFCSASGSCANLQTSVSNCGACGNVCASGRACVAGVCSTRPLYHGWTSPLAGCLTTTYNATATTVLGGSYPYNTGDSNACRAWKLAATVCTTEPTAYSDTNNWTCPTSGGFTDPVFGTYCAAPGTQYSCSTCPGACNAMCAYNPLSLRNCSGAESNQP